MFNLIRRAAYWGFLVTVFVLLGTTILWLPIKTIYRTDIDDALVEVVANHDVGIYACADGVVRWNEPLRVGQRVTKGEELGELRSVRLEQELAGLQSECQQLANRCLEIQAALRNENDPGRRELLRQEFRTTRTQWSGFAEKSSRMIEVLQQAKHLTAPCDGWITEVVTNTHANTNIDQLLVRIAPFDANSGLLIDLSDADFSRVRSGASMRIQFSTVAGPVRCLAAMDPSIAPAHYWKVNHKDQRKWMCRIRAIPDRQLQLAPGTKGQLIGMEVLRDEKSTLKTNHYQEATTSHHFEPSGNLEQPTTESHHKFPLISVHTTLLIRAPFQCEISSLMVGTGDPVQPNQALVDLDAWNLKFELRRIGLETRQCKEEIVMLGRQASWRKAQWEMEQRLFEDGAGSRLKADASRQHWLDSVYRLEQASFQLEGFRLSKEKLEEQIRKTNIRHVGEKMVVKKVFVQPGSVVLAGEPVLELESSLPRFLTLVTPENSAARISDGYVRTGDNKHYRILEKWSTQTGDQCMLLESRNEPDTAIALSRPGERMTVTGNN